MTPLEIDLGVGIACIIIIITQGWIGHRHNKRARAWAEHWHRKFMDCPRSIAIAAENGFEHGHKKGWEDCLDAIEHDKPAAPELTATITSVIPRSETGGPPVTDPANLIAIEPPKGELTLQQEAITTEMLANMERIWNQAQEALR